MSKIIDWTCPFCSLHCDDLVLKKSNDGKIKYHKITCSKALEGLNSQENLHKVSAKSIMNNREVEIGYGIRHANQILLQSHNPIISGLGVDVAGARAIVKMAFKTNAILDHKFGESLTKVTRSIQTKGLFFSSLSELKKRADTVVFVGGDSSKKITYLQKKNFQGKEKKTIIKYGEKLKTKSELIASLQNLSASINVLNFKKDSEYNKKFLKKIINCSYIVFIWDPNFFPDDADCVADTLLEIVRNINKKRRASIIALGGDDGALTMQYTMTWMTGLPLRTAFTTRGLFHQPEQFSLKKIINDKMTDLVFWVSCFSNEIPDFLKSDQFKLIVIGTLSLKERLLKQKFKNYIFIPVATPGLDSFGHMVRCDSVVTVPLKKVTDRKLDSLNDVIFKIIDGV